MGNRRGVILEKRQEKPRSFLPVLFCPRLSWETRLSLSEIKRCLSPHSGSSTRAWRAKAKLSTRWLFLKDHINKPGYVNKKNMRSSLQNLKTSFLQGGGILTSPQCPEPPGLTLPFSHPWRQQQLVWKSGLLVFIPGWWALPKCLHPLPNPCTTSSSSGPRHLSLCHLQSIHIHRPLYSMTRAH